MADRRFVFGFVVTAAWLSGLGFLAYAQRTQFVSMDPNEWGDFLAGAFAPLAFFWLVIGYLQQGEELRVSSKALQLQADELKNSVEQQRELVEVTRLQVESEREAFAHQQAVHQESLRPNFTAVGSGGAFSGDGKSKYNIALTNSGNTATEVSIEIEIGKDEIKHIGSFAVCERGFQRQLELSLPAPYPLNTDQRLRISFRDLLGVSRQVEFSVSRTSDHPHSSLTFSRAAV